MNKNLIFLLSICCAKHLIKCNSIIEYISYCIWFCTIMIWFGINRKRCSVCWHNVQQTATCILFFKYIIVSLFTVIACRSIVVLQVYNTNVKCMKFYIQDVLLRITCLGCNCYRNMEYVSVIFISLNKVKREAYVSVSVWLIFSLAWVNSKFSLRAW